MKGLKKWIYTVCLSFLALVLLPAILSLCFITKTTKALKYNVNSVPIWVPFGSSNYPNFYQNEDGFQITFEDSDFSESQLTARPFVVSYIRSDPDSSSCIPTNVGARPYYHLPYNSSSTSSFRLNYTFYGRPSFYSNSSTFCNYLGSNPNFNHQFSPFDVSFPDVRSALNALPNFRYTYDGFYISDSQKDSDGLVHNSKLDFLDGLFHDSEVYPDKINGLLVPLGSGSSDVLSTYHSGQNINISGELLLIPYDPVLEFGLSSSSSVSLQTIYVNEQGSGITPSTSSCVSSFSHKDSDEEGVYSLEYECSVNLSNRIDDFDESPWFRLDFDFDYISSNTKLYMLLYESSVLITDNDSTFGGDFNDPVSGSNPSAAPGSALQYLDDESNVSWFDSLVNLFNFNFLNPFAPLFSLFTDNSQCVSIPVIAGLLNSEETTYCPWFDSDIRNIVTPVVGLSSTMLLFGFLVRWLGARSGNLFEDSFESSGSHIRVGKEKR